MSKQVAMTLTWDPARCRSDPPDSFVQAFIQQQFQASVQQIVPEESRLAIIRRKADLCQQFQQQGLGVMQFRRQPEKHRYATVLVCLILLIQCGLIIQHSFCIRIKHSSHIIHVKIINYKVQCVRYWTIYMSRHAFIESDKSKLRYFYIH